MIVPTINTTDSLEHRQLDPETGVPLDHKGRYLLPLPPAHIPPIADPGFDPLVPAPNPGVRVSMQRASTFAGILPARTGIETSEQYDLITGLAVRPDLRAMAVAAAAKRDARGKADRTLLRQIRPQALAAGGNDIAANEGTAFHALTEAHDAGLPIPQLTDDEQARYGPMLAAYANLLRRDDVQLPERQYRAGTELAQELVVVHPQLRRAGRLDKVRRVRGRLAIVDVKTGQDPAEYSQLEYAVQLAFYAHCPWVWHEHLQRYTPAPPVDREVAYVLHVPSGGDSAELIAVDIAAGWRYALLALQVEAARKDKALFLPLGRVAAHENWSARPPIAAGTPLQPSIAAAVAAGLQPNEVVAPQHAAAGIPTTVPAAQRPDGTEVRVLHQGGMGGATVAASRTVPVPPGVIAHDANGRTDTLPASDAIAVERFRQQLVGEKGPVPYVAGPNGAEVTAPAPTGAPAEQPQTPPSAGNEQGTGRKQRACSKCRVPGHQARSCNAVIEDRDGTPVVVRPHEPVERGRGKPVAEQQQAMSVATVPSADVQAEAQQFVERAVAAAPSALDIVTESVRHLQALAPDGTCYCRCPLNQPTMAAGWRPEPVAFPDVDGQPTIIVHNACGRPSYGATQASNAHAMMTAEDLDDSTKAWAAQAYRHFSQPPNLFAQPPEGSTWPLPPQRHPAPPPAPVAGATPTPAGATPSADGNGPSTSAPPSTAPPATAAPGGDTGSSRTAPSTGAPPVSAAPDGTTPTGPPTDESDVLTRLRHCTVPEQLAGVITAANAAGLYSAAVADAVQRRAHELMQQRPGTSA